MFRGFGFAFGFFGCGCTAGIARLVACFRFRMRGVLVPVPMVIIEPSGFTSGPRAGGSVPETLRMCKTMKLQKAEG